MPTLRRLLRRLIGLDSADSGNVPTTDERVDQLTAELAYLRWSTCQAVAIHTSQIQDVANELRRNDQTLGTQLEAYIRDAHASDIALWQRMDLLEKLAAATPSAIVNLKPSEN